MGGLGHWRHPYSSDPPLNGAPASYLSPGRQGRPPAKQKSPDRVWDFETKWTDRVPQTSWSPRRVKSGNFHRESRDLGAAVSNPDFKSKNHFVFVTLFPMLVLFWGEEGISIPSFC